MSFPWIRTTTTAALLIVTVAGCGNGGSTAADQPSTQPPSATSTPTPTPAPDLSKLSAAALFAKAKAAVTAADGFRVRGTVTDGEKMTFDVQAAETIGLGKFTVNGEEITVLTSGKTTYLALGEKSIRQRGKEAKDSAAEIDATVKVLKGKWIKRTKKDEEFDYLADMTRRATYLGLFAPSGALTKKPQQTIDGVPAIGLNDGEGTLWVDSRTALPLQMQTAGDTLRFSDFGRIKTPKAPAADDVLDGKAMGL
ncbi:hypothetical protein OG474_26085 [Kribbella sp. NBC_01505]|uniref:hypothetical protein n=1 Tax=Kribbella sp. NBC_01505 TaxID=2903580 RepID=UPI0038637B8B